MILEIFPDSYDMMPIHTTILGLCLIVTTALASRIGAPQPNPPSWPDSVQGRHTYHPSYMYVPDTTITHILHP